MPRKPKNRRAAAVFLLLISSLLLLSVLSLGLGSAGIPPGRALRALLFREGDPAEVSILWQIRLPRMLLAGVLGGALALSGLLLQSFFQNPVAGPYILGISSGAKLFVAAALILFLRRREGAPPSWLLIAAALLGALLVTLFILAISRRMQGMAQLLLAGIMAGYICSAGAEFLVTFAEESDIASLHGWSQGSFSGATMGSAAAASAACLPIFCLAFLLSKPILSLSLGASYARSMGVSVARLRALIILLSSALSGCAAAFAGPVSFVGIAVPCLVRLGFGTQDPRLAIPGSILGGAAFCMGADLLSRTLLAPAELPLSAVTAVFGAPVVIVMMARRRGLS